MFLGLTDDLHVLIMLYMIFVFRGWMFVLLGVVVVAERVLPILKVEMLFLVALEVLQLVL